MKNSTGMVSPIHLVRELEFKSFLCHAQSKIRK